MKCILCNKEYISEEKLLCVWCFHKGGWKYVPRGYENIEPEYKGYIEVTLRSGHRITGKTEEFYWKHYNDAGDILYYRHIGYTNECPKLELTPENLPL